MGPPVTLLPEFHAAVRTCLRAFLPLLPENQTVLADFEWMRKGSKLTEVIYTCHCFLAIFIMSDIGDSNNMTLLSAKSLMATSPVRPCICNMIFSS